MPHFSLLLGEHIELGHLVQVPIALWQENALCHVTEVSISFSRDKGARAERLHFQLRLEVFFHNVFVLNNINQIWTILTG